MSSVTQPIKQQDYKHVSSGESPATYSDGLRRVLLGLERYIYIRDMIESRSMKKLSPFFYESDFGLENTELACASCM